MPRNEHDWLNTNIFHIPFYVICYCSKEEGCGGEFSRRSGQGSRTADKHSGQTRYTNLRTNKNGREVKYFILKYWINIIVWQVRVLAENFDGKLEVIRSFWRTKILRKWKATANSSNENERVLRFEKFEFFFYCVQFVGYATQIIILCHLSWNQTKQMMGVIVPVAVPKRDQVFLSTHELRVFFFSPFLSMQCRVGHRCTPTSQFGTRRR